MAIVSAPKWDIDTVTRVISLTEVPTLVDGELVVDFDIQIDLYSDAKEVWVTNEVLRKLKIPVSVVGGNPLPGSKVLGDTYFLDPSWKIKPYEGSHRLRVNGNFYSTDGKSPFIATTGSFNVFMEHQVSNLVDSTIQQLSEIEYASFEGGVWYDSLNGLSLAQYGTAVPAGNRQNPLDNLTDVKTVGTQRGLSTLYLLSDIDVATGEELSNWSVVGRVGVPHVHLNAGSTFSANRYIDVHVHGEVFLKSTFVNCEIDELSGFDGIIRDSIISGGVTVSAAATSAKILDSKTDVSGMGSAYIDLSGSGSAQILGHTGLLTVRNKTSTSARFAFLAGHMTIEATCTGGTIMVDGAAGITNNATGSQVMVDNHLNSQVRGLDFRIESMRETHHGYGKQFFVDVTNGRSTNDGLSDISPLSTISEAVAKVVSGRNDVITIINPSATGVVHSEELVLTKNNVRFRFPGRDFTWRGTTANGTILTVGASDGTNGYNCSFDGIYLDGNNLSDYCVVVNGKHTEWKKPWMKLPLVDCLLFRGGDYHEIEDSEIEKAGQHGVATEDAGLASGAPREISILGVNTNIYLNTGSGIYLGANPIAPTGTSTRLVRVIEGNVSHNGRYALEIGANADRTMYSSMVMGHDNTLGELLDGGTRTIDMHTDHQKDTAEAVWAHIQALSVKKYLGLTD